MFEVIERQIFLVGHLLRDALLPVIVLPERVSVGFLKTTWKGSSLTSPLKRFCHWVELVSLGDILLAINFIQCVMNKKLGEYQNGGV